MVRCSSSSSPKNSLGIHPQSQSFAVDGNTSYVSSIIQSQGTENCWMSANLNSPIAVETSSLLAWPGPFNETYGLHGCSPSNISSHEENISPSKGSVEFQEADITPVNSGRSGHSVTPLFPVEERETSFSNSENPKPTTEKRGRGKKRLECPHPGCNSTFPRNYELKRHQSTIHESKVSIVCSVYGCNRISKPFPRLDKFYEHVRKHHKGPERFLCVLEVCRQGPLTRNELVEHLNSQHSLMASKQPCLDDILNALNLGGQFRKGEPILFENINACPLRFLGCGYSHPPNSSARWQMEKHLWEHELSERSKGYEMIVAFLGEWPELGIATCPICGRMVCNKYHSISFFILHLMEHTRAERIMRAPELAQMIRPYLTGQEKVRSWDRTDIILEWYLDPEFCARVEEAGGLSPKTHALTGSELHPETQLDRDIGWMDSQA